MPKHIHEQGGVDLLNNYGGGFYGGQGGFSGSEHSAWHKQYTNSSGTSKPFNIRDPYYVLRACQKVN